MIYVLLGLEAYEGDVLLGLYSTNEKAELALAERKENVRKSAVDENAPYFPSYDDYSIEPHELDQPAKRL